MLEAIAAIVVIATAVAGSVKGIIKWRRRRIPREEKNERIEFLLPKLDKINSERESFEAIKKGKHLHPLASGGERISLTTLPFEIIRERVEAIANRRRYNRLAHRIMEIIDQRKSDDLVSTVNELEPPLNKFIRKVEGEIRGLRR